MIHKKIDSIIYKRHQVYGTPDHEVEVTSEVDDPSVTLSGGAYGWTMNPIPVPNFNPSASGTLMPNSHQSINLGSNAQRFNSIYGSAMQISGDVEVDGELLCKGHVRYNESSNTSEYYDGGSWRPIKTAEKPKSVLSSIIGKFFVS